MKKFIFIIFLLFSFAVVFPQGNYKTNKKDYQTALKLFSKEDYTKALSAFLKLDSVPIEELIKDPHENKYVVDNEAIPEIKVLIKYHIGLCYSHNKENKNKAIPYFEFVLKSNYNREPETIYLDLGSLYHQNYQFNRGLLCFEKFTKLYGEKEMQGGLKPNDNYEFAQRMINICKEAQMLYSDSLKIYIQDIGPPINTDDSEFNPLISADGSHLLFNRTYYKNNEKTQDSTTLIFVSNKYNGMWQKPAPISLNPPSSNLNIILAGISPDGQELFVDIKDGNTTDIYSCILYNEKCDELHKLSEPLNSAYNEGKVSLTPDGTEIYFSSDRPGGYGGMDIYKSVKNDKGEWTAPLNLGQSVNSAYDEDSPFIHADKKTLYFSSNGQNTMGGADIFKTYIKENGEWAKPVNLGYPINTINNENDISISASGQTGYFSKLKDNKSLDRKIYTFIINQNIPLTLVKGIILAGDPLKPVAAKIKVIDKETNSRINYIYNPNPKTGQYLLIFPPGKDYDIVIESKDYLPQLINVHIPNQSYFYELFQEIHLKPLSLLDKKLGEEISVSNTFVDIYKSSAGNDIISKSTKKDYDKLLNLVEKLISTTDSIGLGKIDKAFDNIFKDEEIKKDSVYKKDLGRLLDFIDKAIDTTDSTTLKLLDRNTIYRKDYTQKYFYSEDKATDLHRIIIGKDTIFTVPPINTKEETSKSLHDTTSAKIITPVKKIDVRKIKADEKKVILTYKVYFATGKADIENKHYKDMREIVKLLKYNPELYIEIYGYCDSRGGEEENNELSEKRANRVLKYFNEIGVNTETATVIGFGKTFSKEEKTEEDRQKNRRVDVRIFEYVKKKN